MSFRNPLSGISGLVMLLASLCTWAENSTRVDGYTIHHNAIPTGILAPEIATNYGITRSKYRGLLNVAVIKDGPGKQGTPVMAVVNAVASNQMQKLHTIKLKQIIEGEAIYYIGEFPIVDGEILTFKLEIKPQGQQIIFKTQLQQQLFVD